MVGDFVFGDEAPQDVFELGDAPRQIIDGLAFGIGEAPVFEHAAFGADADHPSGHAHHGGVIRHRVDHHAAGADLHIIPDADVP